VRPEAAGYRLQHLDSGVGKRRADSLQQTADSERRRIRESGFGIRDSGCQGSTVHGFKEKRGARKIKETGYHRPQRAYLKEKQYGHH
jgi:hypothetical protein